MIPGKKITAIYGFCDIRQFTDTTECLQEDVMVYVWAGRAARRGRLDPREAAVAPRERPPSRRRRGAERRGVTSSLSAAPPS